MARSAPPLPSLFTWAGACLLLLGASCPRPPALRQAIEEVIGHLDSAAYAAEVPWEEHVVLCYRLAQDRDPTPVELAILGELRLDPGLRRSDVLALALGGGEEPVTWEDVRRFLRRHDGESFRPDASVTAAAQRLRETPAEALAEALNITPEESQRALEHLAGRDGRHAKSEPDVAYQTYFGFLHAHSHLSDGKGGAHEAYRFARDEGDLDFFSLSDHGINLYVGWPWEDKWQILKDSAEEAYAPGSYVTLWGFEWSNPFLGHVSVIQSADFTHTLDRIRMSEIYGWLRDRPEAFARFNHPGRLGYPPLLREFDHFDVHPEAIPQMVGLELWNKEDDFDRYYYSGSWGGNPTSYFDVGQQKGWQLGALGGQDNHNRQWGTLNDFRTAVLAEELTREGILDAYAKRRIYATEDKDLFLDFRASGYPMGSHLEGVPPRFSVTARDGSGDGFQSVRLIRNGTELEAVAASGNPISVTFSDPSPTGSDYYYVIVTQADDGDGSGRNDEAISSPIWIDA